MTATPGLGRLSASQASLENMARRCDTVGSSLATDMAQLIQRIEELEGSAFAGQANAALQDVSHDLNDGLRKIINALDDLASKMSSAGAQYTTHDGDASQQIRSAAAAYGSSPYGGVVTSVLSG